MKTKIVALKRNEDFRSLLKGHKLSNKYFTLSIVCIVFAVGAGKVW